MFGSDADARIVHLEVDTVLPVIERLAVDRHEHFTLGRELDGIGQQVDEDLAQARHVAHQRLGRAVFDQVGQVEVLFLRARRHQVERVFDTAAQVEHLLLELELAGFGLRMVEHVVDDLQQGFAAGADGACEVALVGRHRRVQQQRGHADHGVQRGADLVADVGQEQALRAHRRLGIGLRRLQRPLRPARFAHVAQDRREVQLAVEFNVRDRRLGVEKRAIGAQAAQVAPLAHAACRDTGHREAVHVPGMRRAGLVRQQHLQRRAEHGGSAVAEGALRTFVEQHDALVRVDHDHRVVGDRQQARQQGTEVFRLELGQQRAVHGSGLAMAGRRAGVITDA